MGPAEVDRIRERECRHREEEEEHASRIKSSVHDYEERKRKSGAPSHNNLSQSVMSEPIRRE